MLTYTVLVFSKHFGLPALHWCYIVVFSRAVLRRHYNESFLIRLNRCVLSRISPPHNYFHSSSFLHIARFHSIFGHWSVLILLVVNIRCLWYTPVVVCFSFWTCFNNIWNEFDAQLNRVWTRVWQGSLNSRLEARFLNSTLTDPMRASVFLGRCWRAGAGPRCF